MIDVAALYRQHGAMVFRRARQLLKDAAAAQDAVHDVFITLHERQTELADSGVVSWLYVVTTNLCLKRLRSAATRARLSPEVKTAAAASSGASMGATLEDPLRAPARGEELAAIRGILAGLPEELAAVAVYRFVDEMTQAEIAEVMGCSRRHIGDLLARFELAMAPARRLA